jgi:hypothetical protein
MLNINISELKCHRLALSQLSLNQNKLTGSNYVDWKRNLDIMLRAKGFIL